MDSDRARQLLEAERRRLQGIIDAGNESDFGEAEQERSSDVLQPEIHPSDSAQELYEMEQQDSFRIHAEGELAEVERALGKLADGTYGLDEETGEPIPDERLEILPATRYNVDTKRIDEKRAGVGNTYPGADPTATAGGSELAR